MCVAIVVVVDAAGVDLQECLWLLVMTPVTVSNGVNVVVVGGGDSGVGGLPVMVLVWWWS